MKRPQNFRLLCWSMGDRQHYSFGKVTLHLYFFKREILRQKEKLF